MPRQHQDGPRHRVGGHGRARLGERVWIGDGGQPTGGSPGQSRQQQHRRGDQPGGGRRPDPSGGGKAGLCPTRPGPASGQGRQQPLHPETEGDRLDQGEGSDELLGVSDQAAAGDVGNHQVDEAPPPGDRVGRRQQQAEPGGQQQPTGRAGR